MSVQCTHGQLARQCPICERDAEIARLREALTISIKASGLARADRDRLAAENARLEKVTPGYRDDMHHALIRASSDLDWHDVLWALGAAADQMEDAEDVRQVVEMPDGSRLSVDFDAESRKVQNVYEIRAALGEEGK